MTPEDIAAEDARERYETALRRAREATEARIPSRFAVAAMTDPGVECWVTGVTEAAWQHRPAAGMPVVTRGPSLLLSGVTGTGKTRNAYAAMRALGERGVIAAWRLITAADLYAMLRPRHQVDSEAEYRSVAGTRLLIIDDLAAAKATEWTEEVTYRVVNHRYEHELPTLFTTNALPPKLPGLLGARVASRLNEMTTAVALKGGDRRLGR